VYFMRHPFWAVITHMVLMVLNLVQGEKVSLKWIPFIIWEPARMRRHFLL